MFKKIAAVCAWLNLIFVTVMFARWLLKPQTPPEVVEFVLFIVLAGLVIMVIDVISRRREIWPRKE